MVPEGFDYLSNSWCGGVDYLEDYIPKETLGSRQSAKDIWTHKGYQPDLHEVGCVWQFQKHGTSADGKSRVDSA